MKNKYPLLLLFSSLISWNSFSQSLNKDTNIVLLDMTIIDSVSASVSLDNDTVEKKIKIQANVNFHAQRGKQKFYVNKQIADGVFMNMYEVYFGDNGEMSLVRVLQNPKLDCTKLPRYKKTSNVELVVTKRTESIAEVSLSGKPFSSIVNLEFAANLGVGSLKKTYYVHVGLVCSVLRGQADLFVEKNRLKIVLAKTQSVEVLK